MMKIYEYAREQMKLNGNPNQWVTYPHRDLLEKDIELDRSYVIEDEGRVCGTFVFIVGEDPTYKVIEGAWLNDDLYGTIHRIASDGTKHNIVGVAVDFGFEKVDNVRIDTHEDNKIMQKVLDRLGFTKCGIIYVIDDRSNHSPRIAYQKVKV